MKISTDDYVLIENWSKTFGICKLKKEVPLSSEVTIEVGHNEIEFVRVRRKFFDIDNSTVIFKGEGSESAVRYTILCEALSVLDHLLGDERIECEDIHTLKTELEYRDAFIAKNRRLGNEGLVAIFAGKYFTLIAPTHYKVADTDGYGYDL
ncbi:MAG: hypothetical protein ACXQS2_05595 [Methermicoccaceae archaeon]